MQVKTMSDKREKFKRIRESITEDVVNLATKYGFKASPDRINVKEVKTSAFYDVIVENWEFSGDWIFVFYTNDLSDHCDIDGNITYEYKLYTVPATPNFRDIYKEANFENRSDNQPFRVPKSDFILIENKTGKPAPKKESAKSPKTGHIPFPDLELDSSYIEMDDEHISKLTIGDIVAVMMQAPVSSKSHINERIKQALKYHATRTKN